MSDVFSLTFTVDIKIIFRYGFVASLSKLAVSVNIPYVNITLDVASAINAESFQ